MHFGDQRQESVDALFAQPVGDYSFVAGASVHGIPVFNAGCQRLAPYSESSHDWLPALIASPSESQCDL